MPATLAMHDASYAHISERLEALNLDIEIITFDKAGNFQVGDQEVRADQLDIDYVWLSSHPKLVGAQDAVFEHVLDLKSVGVVQTFNAGLDHPFYKKISNKGTRICNSSAQAVAISEYVMAQVLSIFHPIELQRTLQAENKWGKTPFRELSRTNWLIIGYGPIGQEISKRVKPFGASVSVIRRTPSQSENVDRVGTTDDMATYLADADIVVLACPLNEQTRGFADADFFAGMKENAIMVNIARGGLIDDAAMIAALDQGNLATAILDVFHQEPLEPNNPLWTHPNVRLTSHTSFSGEGVQDRWDELFLDNIKRFVGDETLSYEVNPNDIS